MADWIVQPFECVGPVRFGASRADVRAGLGEVPHEFAKGGSVVEEYAKAGVHAYYDDAEQLEFVEALNPCCPVYAGVQLLGPTAVVVASLNALGLAGREDGQGGIWFDDHGFALYAPFEATEAVSIFRRGYDTGV